MGEKLFFYGKDKSKCKHNSLANCQKNKCWYFNNLSHKCLVALHDKGAHRVCDGEFFVGYTAKKGAAIFMDCECLCHTDKYISPFSGYWE